MNGSINHDLHQIREEWNVSYRNFHSAKLSLENEQNILLICCNNQCYNSLVIEQKFKNVKNSTSKIDFKNL